jgi:predicted short-subunit dehydrogenase-like oxidoreductase (DUF2520 family)
MQMSAKHKIVIIGCGNVAWHLAKHLYHLKNCKLYIYNHRSNPLLNEFKLKFKCKTDPSLKNVISDADFYFICVTDKYVPETVKNIAIINKNAVLIHTSGSLKMEELGEFNNTAVFYPLQSFSKNIDVNWKEIPIIIEAKTITIKKKILGLANLFSNNVVILNYKERLKLHLAAVLVNNFTNALFVAAGDLISKKSGNKQLKILLPLIKQTVFKVESIDPREAQTGPAKRNDNSVMKKHLKLLSDNTDLQNIYKQLSHLVVKQQTKKHA